MLNTNADAIYTSMWGTHLSAFIREGQKRGLFKNKTVVSYEVAAPQNFALFEAKRRRAGFLLPTPLPISKYPRFRRFRESYKKLYNEEPRDSSFLGYVGLHILADAIKAAGSDDPEKLADILPASKPKR